MISKEILKVRKIIMSAEPKATITSKGQITLPLSVRKLWNLKPGDQINFVSMKSDAGVIKPNCRQSIFDSSEKLKFPSIGRSLTQADIDDAINAAMIEKYS